MTQTNDRLREFIIKNRRLVGLKKKELAKLVGMSPNRLGRIENNASIMQAHEFIDICRAIGLKKIDLEVDEAAHVIYKLKEERAEIDRKLNYMTRD